MPELPEVETVKRKLKKILINKKIKKVNVYYKNIIEYPSLNEFKETLIGEVINYIKRYGKWLIFELNNYCLLSHLRMEGKYNLKNLDENLEKHEHVEFIFDDNTSLRYKDTRKFGKMYLYKKDEIFNKKPLSELGLEPWNSNLTEEYLLKKISTKKIPIKTVLLDQSIIVGIGNIYADEILYLSSINPNKKANEIEKEKIKSIIDNTKLILEEAINYGGTTIRSYESSKGVHGKFQENLLVHNLEGKECKKCNTKIVKIKINGRGTYYCPKCQK